MSDVTLSPESLDSLALRIVELMRRDTAPAIPLRSELTTAEAAQYCGFRKMDTFRRWAQQRHISRRSRGHWLRSALDRGMGGVR